VYGGFSLSPSSLKKVGRKEDRKVGYKLLRACVIPGSRRNVSEIFALLGCYVTVIGRYRRFGAAYQVCLQRSSSVLEDGSRYVGPKRR
jgi:hypothetical protein